MVPHALFSSEPGIICDMLIYYPEKKDSGFAIKNDQILSIVGGKAKVDPRIPLIAANTHRCHHAICIIIDYSLLHSGIDQGVNWMFSGGS